MGYLRLRVFAASAALRARSLAASSLSCCLAASSIARSIARSASLAAAASAAFSLLTPRGAYYHRNCTCNCNTRLWEAHMRESHITKGWQWCCSSLAVKPYA